MPMARTKRRELCLARGRSGEGEARPRVFLMPGHGRDAVVQDDGDHTNAIVGRVEQSGPSGMKERGVAYDRYCPGGFARSEDV